MRKWISDYKNESLERQKKKLELQYKIVDGSEPD